MEYLNLPRLRSVLGFFVLLAIIGTLYDVITALRQDYQNKKFNKHLSSDTKHPTHSGLEYNWQPSM